MTLMDSDAMVALVRDSQSRIRFFNRYYAKEFGLFLYATTHVITKACSSVRTTELSTLFDLMRDILTVRVSIHTFTDAYLLYQRFGQESGLGFTEWINVAHIRELVRASTDAQLFSHNKNYDTLQRFDASLRLKRIE